MSAVQRVAQIFGIGFLLVALAGLIASGTNGDPHVLTAPRALWLFPVNLLHNLVHLVFGAWGLIAARSFRASRSYAQVTGVLYILLAVLGFVAPDGFGMMPLGGNDILLHALLGIPLAIVGFTARDRVAEAMSNAAEGEARTGERRV
ncbi:MAG: DUF4383 domain-containing protein [Gemmatimonadaceae bacterium]